MRGQQTNRLEAFSDGVFALSATLLVVSLEVPESYGELVANFAAFPAFAFSFAILLMIWSAHNRFFREFALQDPATIVLTGILLFLVMFFVYPLKFLSTSFSHWALGLGPPTISAWEELQGLFLIYGAAWTSLFLCFTALYLHAWHKRVELELDQHEALRARDYFEVHAINVGVGVLSMLIAWAGVGLRFGLPGMIYGVLGFVGWWHANRVERRHAALDARLVQRPESIADAENL